jgi:hypothetical protein
VVVHQLGLWQGPAAGYLHLQVLQDSQGSLDQERQGRLTRNIITIFILHIITIRFVFLFVSFRVLSPFSVEPKPKKKEKFKNNYLSISLVTMPNGLLSILKTIAKLSPSFKSSLD